MVHFEEKGWGGSCLSQKFGIPILHLFGSPEELGQAHGRILSAQIVHLQKAYLERLFSQGYEENSLRRLSAGMEKFLSPHFRQELQALAQGAGLPFEDIFLFHTFLDIVKLLCCSTFVVAPAIAQGRLIFGRNLDFPTMDVAHLYSLVMVYHPDEGNKFLSVSWPGIAGVLSGMNEAGLALAAMEVFEEETSLEGEPYVLLFRRILQTCSGISQAQSLVEKSPRTTANNLTLVDKSGEACVLEITHREVCVRKAVDGRLMATNHFRSQSLKQEANSWRYDAMSRIIESRRGSIDLDLARQILHGVNLGEITMQSMIFLPQEGSVHISLGTPPTSRGPYIPLEAAELFSAKPVRDPARMGRVREERT
jgi:predicted choloylglycine hydrolase